MVMRRVAMMRSMGNPEKLRRQEQDRDSDARCCDVVSPDWIKMPHAAPQKSWISLVSYPDQKAAWKTHRSVML